MNEAQRLIDRLSREGVEVTAAAWINESESGDWYLYLATPHVSDDGGRRGAYRRLNSVVRAMQEEGFGLDPFEIKMIGPHDPIAKAIVSQRGPGPGGPPRRFTGARLGELAVEQAWLYPARPNLEEAAAGGRPSRSPQLQLHQRPVRRFGRNPGLRFVPRVRGAELEHLHERAHDEADLQLTQHDFL